MVVKRNTDHIVTNYKNAKNQENVTKIDSIVNYKSLYKMCSICAVACIYKCNCIYCPKTLGINKITQCLVCGIEGTCNGDCDAQIHFRGKKFCQICASTKYTITFDNYIPNMHCKEHKPLHKEIYHLKRSLLLLHFENLPQQLVDRYHFYLPLQQTLALNLG